MCLTNVARTRMDSDEHLKTTVVHPRFFDESLSVLATTSTEPELDYLTIVKMNEFLIPNEAAKKKMDNILKDWKNNTVILTSVHGDLSPEFIRDFSQYVHWNYEYVNRCVTNESLDTMSKIVRWENFRNHNFIKYTQIRIPGSLMWGSILEIFRYQFHLLRYCTIVHGYEHY